MKIRNEKGFTLIELLVVIAIIGILAAIAIPQFAEYRAQAFCGRVVSDVKNSVVAFEALYADTESYDGSLAEVVESDGVAVATTAAAQDIGVTSATHPDCLRGSYSFDAVADPQYAWTAAT